MHGPGCCAGLQSMRLQAAVGHSLWLQHGTHVGHLEQLAIGAVTCVQA